MHNIFNRRNIKTSSRNISNNQNSLSLSLLKAFQIKSPLIHIHLAINPKALMNNPHNTQQIIHMKPRRRKYNNLFLLHNLIKHIQQGADLLFRSNHKEIQLHCLGQTDLLVDVGVLAETCVGEGTDVFGHGGAEHQTLGGGAF